MDDIHKFIADFTNQIPPGTQMFLMNRDTLINTVLLEVDKIAEGFQKLKTSDEKIRVLVACNHIMETMRLVELGKHYDEISGLQEDYFVKFVTEFVGLLDRHDVFSKYPLIHGSLLADEEVKGITRTNKFVQIKLQHHHYMRDPRETGDIKNIVYITDFDFQEEWYTHPDDNSMLQQLKRRKDLHMYTWLVDDNENIIPTKNPHLYNDPRIIGLYFIQKDDTLSSDQHLQIAKMDALTYNAYIHGQVYKLTTSDLHSENVEEFIIYGKDRAIEMFDFFKSEIRAA